MEAPAPRVWSASVVCPACTEPRLARQTSSRTILGQLRCACLRSLLDIEVVVGGLLKTIPVDQTKQRKLILSGIQQLRWYLDRYRFSGTIRPCPDPIQAPNQISCRGPYHNAITRVFADRFQVQLKLSGSRGFRNNQAWRFVSP